MTDIEKILYPSLPPRERPKDRTAAVSHALAVFRDLKDHLLGAYYTGRPADDPLVGRHRDLALLQMQNAREAIDGLTHFLTPDNSGQGNLF